MQCKKCKGSKLWDDGICKLCGAQNEAEADRRITIPCTPPPPPSPIIKKDPYFTDTDIDDAFKDLFGLTEECLILMPEGINLYNPGHNDLCDMAQGPCYCGAWHTIEETYERWIWLREVISKA